MMSAIFTVAFESLFICIMLTICACIKDIVVHRIYLLYAQAFKVVKYIQCIYIHVNWPTNKEIPTRVL